MDTQEVKENGIKNDFSRTWFPVHECLLTGCFSLGWSYLGDGGVHWGRGAGGSVLPQPSPSHSCLSARTATSPAHPTHNPGTYSSQYQEWQCVAVSVLSFRTPTVSAGWAISPGSLLTSCTETPVEPLPLPISLTGQLPHYEAEASGPAPVTAGGSQKRRRRGCWGSLQTTQGTYSLVPCSVTILSHTNSPTLMLAKTTGYTVLYSTPVYRRSGMNNIVPI